MAEDRPDDQQARTRHATTARPITQGLVIGQVESFDTKAGLGVVAAPSGSWMFHCTAIADGTRHIAPDTSVAFIVRAGGPGRWEAFDVTALDVTALDVTALNVTALNVTALNVTALDGSVQG